MFAITLLFVLYISPLLDCSIFVYNSEDSPSVQDFDCIDHQATPYCRRLSQAVPLQRNSQSHLCYHNGINHSFRSLRSENVTVHTILLHWKSTIDQVDEYAHYLRQPIDTMDGDRQLCHCSDSQSFGKNCEYLLPFGNHFADVLNAKFSVTSGKLMYAGDIVCYSTLRCDFGLLCLDWRDICDGVQQCMSGLDEENCDKLEFNECEKDEYRCMNGMCIPDEYFLDGEHDCMDMSDEKEPFDDEKCPYQSASMACDDRVCPPNRWSCGDGQCITDRILIGSPYNGYVPCFNQRDRFFWCVRVSEENLWTDVNGRCTKLMTNTNSTTSNYCTNLLVCASSELRRLSCPCRGNRCMDQYRNQCLTYGLVSHPTSGLLAPYVLQYFNVTTTPLPSALVTFLNGSIKCRGYLARFNTPVSSTFLQMSLLYIESFLCQRPSNSMNSVDGGFDRHCHNDSRTFNNRSNHWINVCNLSSTCISAYRINDGLENCQNSEDERHKNDLVSQSCSNVRRHRFRCSLSRATCLPVMALTDLVTQCGETNDELSKGIQVGVSLTKCNEQLRAQCPFLRRLIEASWNSTNNADATVERLSVKRLRFRSYCDTFQDSVSNEDEDAALCQSSWVCLSDEWQCHSGQCIDITWVLDEEWDCPDGSDEDNLFAANFNESHPNYRWLKNGSYVKKFEGMRGLLRFQEMCTAAPHYVSVNRLAWQSNSTECMPEYDPLYVLAYCVLTYTGSGYEGISVPSNFSMISAFRFRKRCSIRQNATNGFNIDFNMNEAPTKQDVTCWDGKIKSQSRCTVMSECPHGEDEFMCGQEDFLKTFYRAVKQQTIRRKVKQVQLPPFPAHTDNSQTPSATHSDNASKSTLAPSVISLPSNLSSLLNWCNRGIPIFTHNRSRVCFCPPQYHGDQCQFHSDRITLITHVNHIQSDYAPSTDRSIVHKFLVLLLFNEQVITVEEFHVRPATEILNYRKKKIYLHYSRSPQHLTKKQERYFNRSNVIYEHPFSIRIEAYELKPNLRPQRFAVWRYPIFFDYLPVFRLATVLRFLLPRGDNPCHQHPCSRNEECYQVQNQRSEHLCLCKTGFSGKNCSEVDAKCSAGHCSSTAVCLPGYQGLINGNDYPYCICPSGHIGERCELSLNGCSDNPCQNGGRCVEKSKPNEFDCECTEAYQGRTCEIGKPSIQLQLGRTVSVAYQVIVVQYLKIDFVSLELNIVGQNVYGQLPTSLTHYHDTSPVPEVAIIKLYYDNQSDIYLLALLLNQTSIRTETSITERNRCRSAQSFFTSEEGSIIRYHQVCRTYPNLLCFIDDIYLCICEEDHSRAECFNYDHSKDTCDRCLANGRCVKEQNEHDFHCVCPACHEGLFCHFNLESASITLDQLFSFNLLSSSSLIRHATYYSLIAVPPVVFLIGLLNNLCCIVTFRRPRCLLNGVGHYLYAMSVCNQLTLAFLTLRLIHLAVNISTPYISVTLDGVLCKVSNYLLTASTRLIYWLSSLVAVERVYVASFINGQWLNKPRIARRIIALTVVSILGANAYQLLITHSHVDRDDENNAMCTVTFPSDSSNWLRPRGPVTAIGSVGPFAINLICTMAIICLVTQKKINATGGRSSREYDNNHPLFAIRFLRRLRTSAERGSKAEPSPITTNGSDREQRAGHRSGLHSPPSTLFSTLFHRFTALAMPKPATCCCPLSSHRLLLHHLHSFADQFSSVHLAIDVLLARMASDECGQVAHKVQTTSSSSQTSDVDRSRLSRSRNRVIIFDSFDMLSVKKW